MSNSKRGILVLKEIPGGEAEKKVLSFLLRFTKKTVNEQLKQKIKNTPFVLSKDIPSEKADLLSEALQKLGASTTFVPHTSDRKPPDREISAVKAQRMYGHLYHQLPKKEKISVQPHPKKNGARRRVMILTFILLILSLGFLAWQFLSAGG